MKNNEKKQHIFALNTHDFAKTSATYSVELESQCTLDDCIEAFSNFLTSVGYVFPTGATLGFEYEEELVETMEDPHERN